MKTMETSGRALVALSLNGLSKESVQILITHASSLSRLTSLKLVLERKFDEEPSKFDEGLTLIADHCELLEVFDISGFASISDRAMTHFFLARKSSLKKMILDVFTLTDLSFANLPRNLVELTIYSCKLGTAGLASIGKLGCLKKLALINLARGLQSRDFVTIFQDRNLCQMESLRLERNNNLGGCIDDEVMEAITRNCPNLTTIYFDFLLGLTFRRGIKQCLSLKCPNITKIGLFASRVGPRGIVPKACFWIMLKLLQKLVDLLPKLKVLVLETWDADEYIALLEHHVIQRGDTLKTFVEDFTTFGLAI
jgi:hypothetical protein